MPDFYDDEDDDSGLDSNGVAGEQTKTMEKIYVVATVLAFKSREKVVNAICKLSLLHTAELYVLSGRGSINYVNVCMLLRAALSLVM